LTRTALAQDGVAVRLTHFRGLASWLFWLPFWLIVAAIFYQLLCVGVFGPSQAGKSYLVSVMGRKGDTLTALFTHRVDAIEDREAIEYPRTAGLRYERGFQNRGGVDISARRRERLSRAQRNASTARVEQPGKHRRPGKIR
jgi:Putative bacterial virulence factor